MMPSDHEIMKAQRHCKNGIRTKIGHGSYRDPPLERGRFCWLVLYGRSLVGWSVKFSDLVILMDSGPFLGFDLVWCNQVGCKKNKKILRSMLLYIFLPTFLQLVYWGKNNSPKFSTFWSHKLAILVMNLLLARICWCFVSSAAWFNSGCDDGTECTKRNTQQTRYYIT